MQAGKRIAAIVFFLIAASAKPAFAQISMGNVFSSNNWSFTCSYKALSCLTPQIPSLQIISDKQRVNPTETITQKIGQITRPSIGTIEIQAQRVPIDVIQTPTPVQTFVAGPSTVNPDAIFELINSHRKSIGLPLFEKDDKVCALAAIRTTEITAELGKGTLHSGLYNRNLPYWIFENAKAGTDEKDTVNWWLHSPIHRASIDGDYKYSCVACSGSYCSQLFTSFSPKIAANF